MSRYGHAYPYLSSMGTRAVRLFLSRDLTPKNTRRGCGSLFDLLFWRFSLWNLMLAWILRLLIAAEGRCNDGKQRNYTSAGRSTQGGRKKRRPELALANPET